MLDRDNIVRTAAFAWLEQQTALFGEVLPRKVLEQGFDFQGARVPLLGPQGIFKPQVLTRIPLSITTSPESPYKDSLRPDGLLQYSYRGSDPGHRDNVGLREAMLRKVPLVYFHGIVPGKYMPIWPVFVVGDNPSMLMFTVVVDDAAYVRMPAGDEPTQVVADDAATVSRRAYITVLTRKRLHQQGFRERVIDAYRQQCACCRLKHEELLDAAHIVADTDPEGEPVVQNGIALCKLHHAAFDSFIIGISPDYIIKVRPDVLEEADGPMLKHGLQGMDGQTIILPRHEIQRPDRGFLEKRFEVFRKSA